jgi:hypothetical protein
MFMMAQTEGFIWETFYEAILSSLATVIRNVLFCFVLNQRCSKA